LRIKLIKPINIYSRHCDIIHDKSRDPGSQTISADFGRFVSKITPLCVFEANQLEAQARLPKNWASIHEWKQTDHCVHCYIYDQRVKTGSNSKFLGNTKIIYLHNNNKNPRLDGKYVWKIPSFNSQEASWSEILKTAFGTFIVKHLYTVHHQ
jgi:hypothetical protein